MHGKSSSGMLSPLCVEHGARYVFGWLLMFSHQVFLYTPVLSENLITQFLPPRWNEVLSVVSEGL